MKRIKFILLGLLVTGFSLNAQIYDPVKWSFSSEKIEEGVFEIVFLADIEEHSHLYSINLPEDNISIPTSFTFEESAMRR